ncbi:type II secretion system protein [Candidatus Microgenomates bacterium]|nr:type II secretion system protein [Candidatus Microgenomates bacterium]
MNLKYLALAIFLREAHKLKVWKRGYTLIEVLVVLAIMSVFSVLAIFGLVPMLVII